MLLTLTGRDLAQSLSASNVIEGAFRSGRKYHLKHVNIILAACPDGARRAKENQAMMVPIVLEKNRQSLGRIDATGYVPEALVVSGDYTRRLLLRSGITQAYAWVDAGLDIQANGEISAEELCQKLHVCLQQKYFGSIGSVSCQATPWIQNVYPFENYFIYDMQGSKHRQAFVLDPVAKKISLSGQSISAAGFPVSLVGQPYTQSGQRPHAESRPALIATHPGGKDCDIVTMVIRDLTNINSALSQYLAATKMGNYKPLTPSFAPVNLTSAGKILQPLLSAGVAPLDFVRWMEMGGPGSGRHKGIANNQEKSQKRIDQMHNILQSSPRPSGDDVHHEGMQSDLKYAQKAHSIGNYDGTKGAYSSFMKHATSYLTAAAQYDPCSCEHDGWQHSTDGHCNVKGCKCKKHDGAMAAGGGMCTCSHMGAKHTKAPDMSCSVSGCKCTGFGMRAAEMVPNEADDMQMGGWGSGGRKMGLHMHVGKGLKCKLCGKMKGAAIHKLKM